MILLYLFFIKIFLNSLKISILQNIYATKPYLAIVLPAHKSQAIAYNMYDTQLDVIMRVDRTISVGLCNKAIPQYNSLMNKPAPKIFRTTNWSTYKRALINRGNISIWFDPLTQWYAHP